jgi:purine-binding chemotaxis protein CheW
MKEKSVLQMQETQPVIQLIVFRVGDEEFGVPIGTVLEIIKVGVITPIPDSPSFIKGLINVRGDIVAIIDVRARFSLSTQEELSRHIVIIKQEGSLFGLLVNEVLEVLRIHNSDIKAPPRLMSKIHEDYVRGVITHDARLIL